MPEKEEQDVNLPYKIAKLLYDKGVLFALGFAFAALGLSIFFNRPIHNQSST